MALRIIIGLALTVVAGAIAGRRLWWLFRLGRTGQPAPERVAALREHPAEGAETQVTEVIGQRKLLMWSVPGIAHALTFWGFIVLILTIIEAYGSLFSKRFAIVLIGTWSWVGFIEDLFAVGVLVGIITFAIIRLTSDPKREGRESRFAGSHTGAAWLVLLGIFLVIATLLIYRGAQINTGDFPYPTRRVRLADRRPLAAPAWRGQQGHRDHLHPAAARGHPGLRHLRDLLQAPAHRGGTDQRAVLPPAQRPWPAGADALERQGAGLRGGRPG